MGNSVIYRPAYDAEVEYLESDGNSYIDTGLKASSELGILAHIYVTGIFPFGGRNGFNNKEFSFCALQNGDSGFRFGSSIAIAQGERVNELYEFDNTQNHNILKVGNTTYVATYNSFISDYNVFLFGLNNAGVAENISSRIYDFKIYNNSTLVRDFIPVRIGSTGYMYDKVTKQLFANKGTGNFVLGNDVSNAVIPQQRCVLYFGNQRSVVFERIYEEYEWLCGRNGAYINTNHKLVTIEDRFDVKARWGGDLTRENDIFGYLTDNANVDRIYAIGIIHYNLGNNLCTSYRHYLGNFTPIQHPISANVPFTLSLYADNNEYHSVCDGKKISQTTDGMTIDTYDDVYLFNMNIGDPAKKAGQLSRYFNGDIAYFIISNNNTEVVHLIPCRLLRPLPAILDGNGIARQAGECGMWDKVSNKFYGNVANSGTFTVKGPKCYEEYEWLKTGSGTPYIQVANGCNTDENAYIETTYKCNYSNGGFDMVVGFSVNQNNNIGIRIFNSAYGTFVDYHKTENGVLSSYRVTQSQSNINAERYIKATLNNLIIDTTEYSSINWGSGFDDVNFLSTRLIANQSNNNVMYKRTKIRANFKEYNLIPCKLTHGIPASMDANGIARPAGTCGMWDKVNDVFYGNVESSGSFTVSND